MNTVKYDAAGRRTQKGGSLAATGFPNAVGSAVYDVANELTNWNGTTITPDANGNILNDGTAAYTWNARNQLITRASTNFEYDPFGRRILNAAGNNLLYEGWNPAQQLSGSTVTENRVLGGIDEFFSRTDSTGAYSPITDALGSVLALTNSSGNITSQYGYDPFGNTTSSGATSTNVFQYTDRESDGNGLYFNRARYYDPTFGRFISEDPVGFAGGINLYGYADDNPITFRDPFGTDKGCGWTPNPNATPYEQPVPNRNAGFTQVNVSVGPGIAWSPSVTVDDYGNVYVAPIGVAGATPGASVGVSRGYLPNNPFPSEQDLVNNISGNSFNFCGAYGVLGCRGWTPGAPPGDTSSAQLGLGTPAASASWSYAWKLPWKLFHNDCQ